MASAIPTVSQLLAQRAQILGWLARLDEERDAESLRIVDRVRSDYQQRLHGVVQELSVHLGSLRAELASARERHQQADARFTEAEDALYEARLRHRIGEVSADVWEARRSELEVAVQEAADERDAARTEVERLEDVLSQIEAEGHAGSSGIASAAPTLAPANDTRQGSGMPDAAVEQPESVAAPAAESGAGGVDQDLAFLEQLDRAIASSGVPNAALPEEEPEEEEQDDDARPLKGTKCPECGYTNDADAWYCGVCGVDLA